MTEFYLNRSAEEIETIVREKMSIYPDDFDYRKYDRVPVTPSGIHHFPFRYFCEAKGLDVEKHECFRYFGVLQGIAIYDVYHVVEKSSST